MNLKAANDIFGVTLQDTSLVREKPVLINGILPSAAYRYPFKLLTLAGVAVPNPNVQLLPPALFSNDMPPLVLGIDTLRLFHVYIAYDEEKVYLAPAKAN
jgi:hypothetical protein